MKKFLITICISLLALVSGGQSIKPGDQLQAPIVDKRVELLSIAARLAGYEEYNTDFNKIYVADIHQYFDQYKDHPLIKYMREIREPNSIAYDALMSMAKRAKCKPC